MRPQLFACKHCGNNQKLTAPNALELNTWTHLAITIDNRTANLYVNGENVGTHDSIDTEFNRLKVGLNRYVQQPWKGYIDELMIFGDAMTDADIANIYKNTLPGTPENVVAINSVGDTVVVGWDTVEDVNEYNVYYSMGGTIDTNSPYITVTGGTVVNFDNLTPGQHYTYAVAGVSPLGVGELSAPATIAVDGEVEPVYGNTTVGIWYHNDYILDSYWNAPSWNSNRHQLNSNNHNHTAVIILLDDDKIKQHGMGIHNNKTTKTFNVVDFTASGDMSFEQHIDIVDKHGGWSYFEYVVDIIDQRDRDIYARSAGNTHCVGVDFKTIAEYTACNPAFFQQQKDKWARDGQNKNVLLNDIVPVRDRYYTIEVKRFEGNQHYNYNVKNCTKEFVMVTQKN
jgi:hypothetical protein